MRDQLLLLQHELQQRLVGIYICVLYTLVEPKGEPGEDESVLRSLWLVHDRHFTTVLLDLSRLLHLDPAFPYDIEVLASQQDFVFPRLQVGRYARPAWKAVCAVPW